MKSLEIKEMELIEGGRDGFWAGFACGAFGLAILALSVPTAGASVVIGGGVTSIACGVALGYELNN
jgi:hypothetical protein